MHELGIAVVIPAYKAGRFSNETFERVCAKTIVQWKYRIAGEGSTDETPPLVSIFRDQASTKVSLIDLLEFEAICTKVVPPDCC